MFGLSARCLLAVGLLSSVLLQAGNAAEPIDRFGVQYDSADWPLWRGVQQDGHAAADATPPTQWSETDNVRWRTPVPGRGHGSPIVAGNRVYLASSDHEAQTQSVYAFDKSTGELVWEKEIHRGGMDKALQKLNQRATMASSALAWDGERLFITFIHDEAAWVTALSTEGDTIWQKRITDYTIHQGYGASPTIYHDLVIVSADNKAGGVIVGLDRRSGKVVWEHTRPKKPNYPSPILLQAAGKDQLIMTGADLVTSLNPSTGKVLWETPGATTECVTSTVSNGKVLLTSGGYPESHMSAVSVDGSKEVVWENRNRVYVPSMLMVDDYVYAVLDAGVAICIDAATGKEQWKERLGGTFNASPILVGNTIYISDEDGTTYLFKAQPDSFELVGKNQLGESVFASPAFSGDQFFTRVAHRDGDKRQEYLYCIGN
ncbi:Polyvinylalcohol dehydrogenase precursor [Roseimaritima multifibrata]|uniref:Polyvinylalcohol dehydrogenase n=1 Tax=Roseimaritima multifibrata TaxID=1930274 RepID=A0A517MIR7_9BACT|nr:PQQ-binding-like beta-propeller repeat protein [Roseimaritima multifibrata]QDS94786.1 Polyvinylalcohol dehydrogenase precursor [Roseimaritima multifibrata]